MPLVAEDIDYLRTLVVQRSGNVISSGQGYLLESRLVPVARGVGLKDLGELLAALRKAPNSSLHDKVAEAMTINETSFFRDNQPFEELRLRILPELIRSRAATRQLWVWSGAASSGQEAYSIAMTIREHFPELSTWNVKIVATDLADEMLQRVRDGKYTQFEVNRGLPAKMLVKYFDRQGTVWQVKEDLRRMIDCRKLNLTTLWPTLPQFDVVFLRNVLIYFDQPMKASILTRVHRQMRPDARLFLGGGETLINLNVPFVREPIAGTVCLTPVGKKEVALP